MNHSPLLSQIDRKALNIFRKDLNEILRLGKEMDRYYAESNQDVDIYLKKFNSLVESFNKKYKNLKLRIRVKTNSIELNMFLNEKNVKEVFANSASKIVGVQSVGANKFGAAFVTDQNSFANELEKAKNKLHITYYDPKTGTTNIFLAYGKKEKKVQLVYDLKEIENKLNPEFQIAAFYALNQGYNKNIDIHDEATTLGFSSILSHVEKARWFEKFDPHISE